MEQIFFFLQHHALEYVLPFLIVISTVVFAHEYGHYWVARRCGIKIESFSLGFGPKLFGWTDKHGTVWQVAALPLGGYVKMFGDADAASSPDEAVKTMTDAEKKVAFYHQPVNKRIAVVGAGPVANYFFAILVLAALFMLRGQPFSPPIVEELFPGSVAEQAGIRTGDKVMSIDGQKVERFEDIKRIIRINMGTPVPVVVDREGVTQTITLTPKVVVQEDRLGGKHPMGQIGIATKQIDYQKRPPLKAIQQAVLECWNMSADTIKALGQVFAGTRGSDEIGGPLRIAEMSGQAAQDGIWTLIYFTGIISINLGLINLFPVPLLDGGHLLFFICEKLRGKPLAEKTQEIGLRIGMTFVIFLMVFATWNDIAHLAKL
ncbi:MAG: RIP metalloprotease RseP [Alphaproteobacteria bacterium]|nr:RIP metalloprotease RseP [Alphaproteobacteria bacterium]